MKPPRFRAVDKVRITNARRKVHSRRDRYKPLWTEEVFTISLVLNTQPPTYRLKDFSGEEIQGSFYEPELQKTDQDVYRIEKILPRRTMNGINEVFVK